MSASGCYLTVAAAAEIAAVTPWWVRRLINTGELRAINVAARGKRNSWRIDPADLAAWMTSRENRRRDLFAA